MPSPWQDIPDPICQSGIKAQILAMGISGSGVPDTDRVLGVSQNTVISAVKKAGQVRFVHPAYAKKARKLGAKRLGLVIRWAETGGFWSYVQNKNKQRWTWYVPDHQTGRAGLSLLCWADEMTRPSSTSGNCLKKRASRSSGGFVTVGAATCAA